MARQEDCRRKSRHCRLRPIIAAAAEPRPRCSGSDVLLDAPPASNIVFSPGQLQRHSIDQVQSSHNLCRCRISDNYDTVPALVFLPPPSVLFTEAPLPHLSNVLFHLGLQETAHQRWLSGFRLLPIELILVSFQEIHSLIWASPGSAVHIPHSKQRAQCSACRALLDIVSHISPLYSVQQRRVRTLGRP